MRDYDRTSTMHVHDDVRSSETMVCSPPTYPPEWRGFPRCGAFDWRGWTPDMRSAPNGWCVLEKNHVGPWHSQGVYEQPLSFFTGRVVSIDGAQCAEIVELPAECSPLFARGLDEACRR